MELLEGWLKKSELKVMLYLRTETLLARVLVICRIYHQLVLVGVGDILEQYTSPLSLH